MLNSTEHEFRLLLETKILKSKKFLCLKSLRCGIYHANECWNANNCWHFNIYVDDNYVPSWSRLEHEKKFNNLGARICRNHKSHSDPWYHEEEELVHRQTMAPLGRGISTKTNHGTTRKRHKYTDKPMAQREEVLIHRKPWHYEEEALVHRRTHGTTRKRH